MKISEICEILGGEVLAGEDRLDTDVFSACGSDMMSDVLAYVKDQAVLLTGLVNAQVVRTCNMMDIHCVVFVRGKVPSGDILDLAREHNMTVITTCLRLYSACGKLYKAGLGGDGE
ncbi:hypothetical protein FACS1894219_02700 [Clostridia bacterium]|nr:hypothetical protein FACS1894219_02700 [Clostridia bacterium]